MRTFTPQTKLRSEPRAEAEQVMTIAPDTEVEVLEQVAGFYRVSLVDEFGQPTEGFIASRLLRGEVELGEQDRQPPSPDRQWAGVLPRFDRTSGWLAIGLLLVLLGSLVSTIMLYRAIRDLQNRPNYVTCTGGGYSTPVNNWGSYLTGDLDPAHFQNDQVKANVSFQVYEKLPGSSIVLRYRLEDDGNWRETRMQETDRPLVYLGTVVIERNAKLSYQVLQRVGGETVRASADNYLDAASRVGSGDVNLSITRQENGATHWYFWQDPRPAIQALQVERITIKLDQKQSMERELVPEEWQDGCELIFRPDGFRGASITVRYRDGQERTVEFEQFPPMNPAIKR